MSSVFDEKNMSYALEKIHDFINGSGSGAHGFGVTGAEIIVKALEELEAKIRKTGSDPDESSLPTALYAARELQKYVNRKPNDIANSTAARVYTTSLRADITDLQTYEKDMES
jgi:hypothetical protein